MLKKTKFLISNSLDSVTMILNASKKRRSLAYHAVRSLNKNAKERPNLAIVK